MRVWLAILVAGLLAAAAHGGAGVGGDGDGLAPSHQDAPAVPRAVPYNASFYLIVDEAGRESHPAYGPGMMPGMIAGDGWEGRKLRNRIVATRYGWKYVFENGYLVSMTRPGVSEWEFAVPEKIEGGIDALFPSDEEVLAEVEAHPEDLDIWSDDGRLRWFYGNPNKTAMLFVFLALFGVWFGFNRIDRIRKNRQNASVADGSDSVNSRSDSVNPVKSRAPALWNVALACAAVLAAGVGAWGVYATQSRGAFVALAVALAAMAARFLTWKRLLALAAVAAVAVGLLFALPGGERFTKHLAEVDASNSIRVNILRAFPEMLHAAPGGWGWGKSGIAYVTWFQPEEEIHPVRTLLNTHFTWLAEFGAAGRVAYLWAWVFAAGILFWRKKPLALGMVVAMAVAGMFNHVGEEWTLWVPVAAALGVAASAFFSRRDAEALETQRLCEKKGAAKFAMFIAAAALGVSCGVLKSLDETGAKWMGERPATVAKVAEGVRVAGVASPEGEPVRIVADHYATGGWTFFGKELEAFFAENPSAPAAMVVDALEALPEKCGRLVLTGRACRDAVRGEWKGSADSVLMVSPACPVSEIARWAEGNPGIGKIRVAVGEMLVRRGGEDAATFPDWVRVVRGAELYVPNWIKSGLTF